MTQVSSQIRIDAPKEKVWEVLADFGGVSRWAPTVLDSYSTTGANGGVGAGRHCDVKGFGGIEEEIVRWEAGRSLGVSLDNAGPIKSSVNEFTVIPGDDGTVVTLTVDFQAKFGPAGAVLDRLVVRRQMEKTITLTLAGLKHYVETGEPMANGSTATATATV